MKITSKMLDTALSVAKQRGLTVNTCLETMSLVTSKRPFERSSKPR